MQVFKKILVSLLLLSGSFQVRAGFVEKGKNLVNQTASVIEKYDGILGAIAGVVYTTRYCSHTKHMGLAKQVGYGIGGGVLAVILGELIIAKLAASGS